MTGRRVQTNNSGFVYIALNGGRGTELRTSIRPRQSTPGATCGPFALFAGLLGGEHRHGDRRSVGDVIMRVDIAVLGFDRHRTQMVNPDGQ